jgi:hypothetical protein
MTNKELLDIYSEYLISAFRQTTGTGLAALLEGSISHDQVQRFRAGPVCESADLWRLVKPQVRAMQREDGVLIIDDSIAQKPYTDENDIVCWHYDHAHDRLVKGINCTTPYTPYRAAGQAGDLPGRAQTGTARPAAYRAVSSPPGVCASLPRRYGSLTLNQFEDSPRSSRPEAVIRYSSE